MPKSKENSKVAKSDIKYIEIWEEDPRLKDWIAPMNDGGRNAYCKACRRPFHPQKKVLLLHAKSKKHIEKMQLYEQVLNSQQPFKEMIIEDPTMRENAENISVNIDGGPFEKESAFMVQLNVPNPNLDDTTGEHYLSEKGNGIEFIDLNVSKETIDHNVGDDVVKLLSKSELQSWKTIPELKGWLSISNDYNVECLACKKEMKPKKIELLKHSLNKAHIKKFCKMTQLDQNINVKSVTELNASMGFSFPYLPVETRLIDMRSDTVSIPSKDMKEMMLNTELGDDHYESDPTVKNFEERVCSLLEKECSILFPSGTMANLVAVMTHCWKRDCEVIAGDQSFIYKYSQSSLAKFSSIAMKPIKNESDGTFSLETLKEHLREHERNSWQMQLLVCIENSHSNLGGRPIPVTWLEDLGSICSEHGVSLHMDGARLLNASLSTGTAIAALVRNCDSTTFCLNKGLGVPMGSMLVGEKLFIEKAKSIRQMLGGTIHQAGMIAAAGLYALDNNANKLTWDHCNARAIATAVRDLYSTAVRVELNEVQTNIVHFYTDNIRVNSHEFCERLSSIKENEELSQQVKLHLKPLTNSVTRLVTHCGLSKYDIMMATRKLKHVIKEYDNMLQINIDPNYKVVSSMRTFK